MRQCSHDFEPVGYFEGGQPVAAVLQDLLGPEALTLHDHGGADSLPVGRVRDGEYGRLGDTGTPGENVLDVLGRDLLATAVDEALDAPGEEQVPVLVQ
jgi:hypothetical protein